MRLRHFPAFAPPSLGLALTLMFAGVSAGGCKGQGVTQRPGETLTAPANVENIGDFYEGLNVYAQIRVHQPGSKRLPALREQLSDWALDYADERLNEGELAEAQRALEVLVGLWSPAQLRQGAKQASIAKRARKLYALAAAAGHEPGAVFSLAAMYQFGEDEDQEYAQTQFGQLQTWIERAGQYATEPGTYLDLETVLQESLAIFPGPWTLDQLSAHLLNRYAGARRAGGSFGIAAQSEYTGYILARAQLRADNPRAALDALESVKGNEETAALAHMLRLHIDAPKQLDPLLDLISYFAPSGDAPLPGWVEVQSWAIVEHIAARVLRLDPKHALANLAMGRAFADQGLVGAAIAHYERSIDKEPESFSAWPELAALYQTRLQDLAASDAQRAQALLPDLERFHRDAARRWRDRPVEPGLPQAYMTLALSLYGDGEADQALKLAEASVAIEPTPSALDLIGTIAHKRGELDVAAGAFDRVFELGFDNAGERLHWEIAAHLELAAIETMNKDAVAGRRHLKAALRHLNGVLQYPQLDAGQRGRRHTERGQVYFALGHIDKAMTDFTSAASFAPERPTTFVRPVLILATHGYYDEAKQLYARAMNEDTVADDLKLYLSLWILELSERTNSGTDARASEYIAGFTGEGWMNRLAAHHRGEISYDQLLEAAENRGHKAEAHYYEAMRMSPKAGLAQRRGLLEKVIASGMVSFYEFEMAQQYLDWEELPSSARRPLTEEQTSMAN